MDLSLTECVLLVAAGGALGAATRYLFIHFVDSSQFPWATLAVNLIGSFLLAFLTFWYTGISPEVRLVLFTGFFGAFTTMSTFTLETTMLFTDGYFAKAFLNVLLTLALCFGGAAAGRWAGMALAA
ncbi:MAG: fluoride efflux transporter CrcB [Methanomethylophilus sp.]|jgi:CrcB protein